MWLLEVETYALKFFAVPPPRYAILSHTWGDDEVIFQDLEDIDSASQKAGWDKIKYTCHEALNGNIHYVWVDSCCIDKSSSAELSEAINSMFEWYRRSFCCYVYLSDVQVHGPGSSVWEQLERSRWFTRGWTLQELVAPQSIRFFDHSWKKIGTKDSLCTILASITGIDAHVLEITESMFRLPVGRRMSWAAKRQTTRVEDMAYCLLGIFGINMPLLYGEGERSFMRLQEEISRQHQDLSIFAWSQEDELPLYRGLFATSPAEFVGCSSLVSRNHAFFVGTQFSVSDRGFTVHVSSASEFPVLRLGCMFHSSGEQGDDGLAPTVLGIRLQKFGDFYVRSVPRTLIRSTTSFRPLDPEAYWNTSETEPISVLKTLPRSHSDLIQLVRQRRLIVFYRANLVDTLDCPPLITKQTPQPHSVSTSDFKWIFSHNSMSPMDFGFIRSFRVGFGGVDPIWWDIFSLSYQGGKKYTFVLMCGIPTHPDAPSEHLLPWFALFCDQDKSNSVRREVATLLSRYPRLDAQPALTRRVGDIMFENYADSFGNIGQDKLPQSFVIDDGPSYPREIAVVMFSGGASTYCADIRLI